jgi:twitching motility two-component system response regulator PilH
VDHIVAVDDSHVIRRLVEVSLDPLNVRVETAESGVEACERLLTTPPDLLILDIGLPDMNGWDVLHFVQSEPALDGLPVIMLTGQSDAGDKARADRRGVAAYMVKPFRPADLRSVVMNVLRDPAPTTA